VTLEIERITYYKLPSSHTPTAYTMSQRQIIITYRKPGTQPPVYVAGTFSNPQWQPFEMTCFTDKHGDHRFEKVVSVQAGRQVQYKFRLGTGNWWVCDENVAKGIKSIMVVWNPD
jgi:hypothetical protein